jgi:hypothetical protein
VNLAKVEADVSMELDVDGIVDARGIRYIGKAAKHNDGTWTCLADVGGALCRVEVTISWRTEDEPKDVHE